MKRSILISGVLGCVLYTLALGGAQTLSADELLSETVTVKLSGELPEEAAWSPTFDLDTINTSSGGTIQLLTTDSIAYSAKWAVGYDRQITLTIAPKTGVSSLGQGIEILTGDVEEEGSYAWDYSVIDPSILPRSGQYSLSYTIFDDDTVFADYTAQATITLVPEPAAAICLLFMAALFIKRK